MRSAVTAIAVRFGFVLPFVWLWATPVWAAPPCDVPANAIVAENCLPGSPPSEWDVDGAGDASIQGFAIDISVNRGGTIQFKVKTDATDYRLDIYRLGYYGGMGARLVATVQPSAPLPQVQPVCLFDGGTRLLDCGNWAVSASWAVPASATSGIYLARLVREDPEDGRASHVAFVVRDDDGGSDLLVQTSDTTWQAYNQYGEGTLFGGNSLYSGPGGKAVKVSYNRPFTTRGTPPEDWLFNAEYPMVRWLERNGYDVSYTTDVDGDRRGAEILEHQVFLSVGHDEYWSRAHRDNVRAARDAGVHLGFFSGNDIYWKVRWEASIDGSATSYRTLVTYKEGTLGELACGGKCDPLPNVWTGLWRDGCSFTPPADGCEPENALSGQISWVGSTAAIQVPGAYAPLRFWRNTSIAGLLPAETATLSGGTLGYEWDWEQFPAFYPPGRLVLSSTTIGAQTHRLSLYRHTSGALVFGAGSVQWSWGLDGEHDRGGSVEDARMQQATVNLFADMGAQPATLQAGLVPASASTDVTAPTSTITAPASGATVASGSPVTITGTASDVGGVVAAVQVSVDGGTTWQAATGTTSWSFNWIPSAIGATTLRSRAVDDSANLSGPSAPVNVTVEAQTCPCSIWSDAVVPGTLSSDTQAVELGVKFRADVDALVTGIRFYKGPLNTGTHVGHLWTAGGAPLATATFTGETASGWQTVALSTPVAITANTTYVVSYHTAVGQYAIDQNYFASAGVDNVPLHALSDGLDGPNGVFNYGPPGVFPTSTFNASNYWVDVVVQADDFDNDGFPAPEDCNDADPTVFPGAPELCDGQDNDCDTVVDEGDPGGGASCSTGQPGVCGPGTRHCVNGTLACVANLEASAEICDGLDNDCDGQTDEGNPGGGGPCGASNVGVCHFGVRTCQGGSLVCVGNVDPSPEQCNGLDDDCDGTADDGDPGSGASCSTGQPGVCGPGTRHCVAGALQCVGNVNPSAEACDGLDNDCDGAVDEGNPGSGAACSTGLLGACAAGTRQCLGGGLVCVPNTPAAAETCNGIDDDCDGAVDEGNPGSGGACATGLFGVCAAGTYQCRGGLLVCVGPSASAEVCDGLDNDCDGQVDEGNVCCGNGLPNPGETCDDGNTASGDCCSASCQFEPASTPCNDGNACTAGEHCNGAGACVGATCQVGMPCGVVCGQTKTCQQPQPGVCQCQ